MMIKKCVYELDGESFIYLGLYHTYNIFLNVNKKLVVINDFSEMMPISNRKFLDEKIKDRPYQEIAFFNKLLEKKR